MFFPAIATCAPRQHRPSPCPEYGITDSGLLCLWHRARSLYSASVRTMFVSLALLQQWPEAYRCRSTILSRRADVSILRLEYL